MAYESNRIINIVIRHPVTLKKSETWFYGDTLEEAIEIVSKIPSKYPVRLLQKGMDGKEKVTRYWDRNGTFIEDVPHCHYKFGHYKFVFSFNRYEDIEHALMNESEVTGDDVEDERIVD